MRGLGRFSTEPDFELDLRGKGKAEIRKMLFKFLRGHDKPEGRCWYCGDGHSPYCDDACHKRFASAMSAFCATNWSSRRSKRENRFQRFIQSHDLKHLDFDRLRQNYLVTHPRTPPEPEEPVLYVIEPGLRINKQGYVRRGKMLLHRLVYEEHFGPIPQGWVVHHIDGVKTNNEPENLFAMHAKVHQYLHEEMFVLARYYDRQETLEAVNRITACGPTFKGPHAGNWPKNRALLVEIRKTL